METSSSSSSSASSASSPDPMVPTNSIGYSTSYGLSTDPVSNHYVHSIRAYTGIDAFHDFAGTRGTLTKPIHDTYQNFIYKKDPTPENDFPKNEEIYEKLYNKFGNNPSDIENLFLSSIIKDYDNPDYESYIRTSSSSSSSSSASSTGASFINGYAKIGTQTATIKVGKGKKEQKKTVRFDNIPPKDFWARFRLLVPEYNGHDPRTINHTLLKTTTISIDDTKASSKEAMEEEEEEVEEEEEEEEGEEEDEEEEEEEEGKGKGVGVRKGGAIQLEGQDINRYIATKISLKPEFNTGRFPTTTTTPTTTTSASSGFGSKYSFSERFFQVVDFHKRLADSFIVADSEGPGTPEERFRSTFSGHAEKLKPVTITIDTDKGLLSRLIMYDNTRKSVGSIPDTPARKLNFITTRETLHDPASKQSPFTADTIDKKDTKRFSGRNNTEIQVFIEKPGPVLKSDDDINQFGRDGVIMPGSITYPTSPYLQNKYSTITISPVAVENKDTTGVQLVDFTIRARVENNMEGDPKGTVNYGGKDSTGKKVKGKKKQKANSVKALISKVNKTTSDKSDDAIRTQINLIASKRYGDQLQAYVCKNNAEFIRQKIYTDVNSLKSVPIENTGEYIGNPANNYVFEGGAYKPPASLVANDPVDLGNLYILTGDRPLSGYSMLTGINYIFIFEEGSGKNKQNYAYIFTYAGNLLKDRNYVGGTKTKTITSTDVYKKGSIIQKPKKKEDIFFNIEQNKIDINSKLVNKSKEDQLKILHQYKKRIINEINNLKDKDMLPQNYTIANNRLNKIIEYINNKIDDITKERKIIPGTSVRHRREQLLRSIENQSMKKRKHEGEKPERAFAEQEARVRALAEQEARVRAEEESLARTQQESREIALKEKNENARQTQIRRKSILERIKYILDNKDIETPNEIITEEIGGALNDIFIDSLVTDTTQIVYKSRLCHPLTVLKVVLSAIYLYVVNNKIDEDEYSTYLYLQRLILVVITDVMSMYDHKNNRYPNPELTYSFGRFLSVVLIGALYNSDLMHTIMGSLEYRTPEGEFIFGGAQTFDFFLKYSVFLSSYAQGIFIPSQYDINGELNQILVNSKRSTVFNDIFGKTMYNLVYLEPEVVIPTENQILGHILDCIYSINEKYEAYTIHFTQGRLIPFGRGVAKRIQSKRKKGNMKKVVTRKRKPKNIRIISKKRLTKKQATRKNKK